ncbi:MAG: replisome organizer [Eubacteriales bacterium]|nr:replisome organizer [Eubacteriales bacterium]
MAERRMFAKTIIDSDMFIDMPISARLLYYDLAMRADDDGFVNSPKKIMKFVGASVDDMNVLIARQFIIPFESGVVVIKHWRIHNYIRKDTYKETPYKDEKALLYLDKNNGYRLENECPSTNRQRTVNEPSTQDRLGKDRIELGKDRVRDRDRDRERQELESAHAPENLPLEIAENKNNKNNENDFNISDNKKPTRHKYGIYKNVFLTDEDMEKLKTEFPDDWQNRIERLSEYIASSGKTYKNHLATIRVWAKKDKEREVLKNGSENGKWCMDKESISLDEIYGLEVTK